MTALAAALLLRAAAGRDAPPPRCPSCPGPKNLLVLGDQMHAGLSDRETIIGSTGLLATRLCARLVAPLPCRMLNGRHGLSVSCRLDWTDFFALVDDDGDNRSQLQNTLPCYRRRDSVSMIISSTCQQNWDRALLARRRQRIGCRRRRPDRRGRRGQLCAPGQRDRASGSGRAGRRPRVASKWNAVRLAPDEPVLRLARCSYGSRARARASVDGPARLAPGDAAARARPRGQGKAPL